MCNSQNQQYLESISRPQRDTESDFLQWVESSRYTIGLDDNFISPCNTISSQSISFGDETHSRTKSSEKEKKDVDQRYNNLLVENENLNLRLASEMQRCDKLENKLKYIQENQEKIDKLKQSYLSAKYNESLGKRLIQVREQASQTWKGIICGSCIKTAETRRFIDKVQAEKSDDYPLIVVKKSDLSKLKATVANLKTMVNKREDSWSYNEEREEMYKKTIVDLQTKLSLLEELIQKNKTQLDKFDIHQDYISERAEKENKFLRNIVVKLEKQQRELVKTYNIKKRQPFPLTQTEKDMVQELIRKYAVKVKDKILEDMVQQNKTKLLYITGNESSGDQ